jgi:predicted dehydrogenase
MNRRKFLNNAVVTSAGVGMVSSIPHSLLSVPLMANDSLNVALIGCRSMGFGDLEQHLANPGVHCVALCDIDERIMNSRASEVKTRFNQNPKLYKDFRKMLEQKDIDAVIIGTPDHWHCLQTVYALQAGKHVYVEKPMANSIEECNIMVKAAKRYNKIVQVGQQQRSGFIFQKAVDMVHSGSVGNIRKINIWANFNYGAGSPIVPDEPVPAGIDFDMWLGPAPERTFNPGRFHGMWRMFWDYGGGLVSDWGVHLLDIALWAKKITAGPEKILVYAGHTFPEKRARETFDTMSVSYPGKDFVINYDVTAGIQNGPYNMPYGIAMIGDKGTIVADRNKLQVFPEWDEEAKNNKAEAYIYNEGKESHGEHARNFIESIRSGKVPACPPEYGRAAALYVHMANIAGRTGEPVLLWNETQNRFTNSESANSLIKPAYRGPWHLPEIT